MAQYLLCNVEIKMGYKIQKIYVGDKLVRPKGGGGGFTPGEHTLSYLPMTAETKNTDYGTLGWTWTVTGTEGTSYKFEDNYYYAAGNSNTSILYTGPNTYATYNTYTACLWIKLPGTVMDVAGISNYSGGDNGNLNYYYDKIRHYAGGQIDYTFSPTLNDNTWHSTIVTMSPTSYGKCYLDGVLYKTVGQNKVIKPQYVALNSARAYGGSSMGGTEYLSDFILEDRERTADEVAAYYDSIKGNYGK